MKKIYPDSKVELTTFISKHYDTLLNIFTAGIYKKFIGKVISDMHIQENDHILDLGCGTGRNACLMQQYINDHGFITGLDISPIMLKQFTEHCTSFNNTETFKQRIDKPFDLGKKYDIVFISFVIHGFPHAVRMEIIKNAFTHLKQGGYFMILDFSEFSLKDMPFHHRIIFKTIECKYAFDFITHDWQSILSEFGFGHFDSKYYLKNYVRLLKVRKQ